MIYDLWGEGNQWSLRIKIKNVSMTWLKPKREKKQHYRYMSLEWFCMKIYRERWLDGFMWQSVYVCIYVINVDDGGLNYTNWFAGYSSRHNISKYFSMYENTQNQLVLNVRWNLQLYCIIMYTLWKKFQEKNTTSIERCLLLIVDWWWLVVDGGWWR